MNDYPHLPNQLRAIADALNSTSIRITARGIRVRYAAELIETDAMGNPTVKIVLSQQEK